MKVMRNVEKDRDGKVNKFRSLPLPKIWLPSRQAFPNTIVMVYSL